MDLRHLRYFVVVAEAKTISRAAIRLHISRPPLTCQIQQREEDLGVQLFNRTPRGMELAPAGELLLEDAQYSFGLGTGHRTQPTGGIV